MPLLTRKSVLAAAIETDVGVAETLDAGDAAFNIFDCKTVANIPFVERPGQSSFDPLPGTYGGAGGTVTFQTEITGGATDPSWASVLLPACGFVGATHVYTPRTEAPGTNVKTLTMAFYENGRKKVLRGCMGTAVLKLKSGDRAMIEWTFSGLWVAPTDATILAPTYPTVAPLRFVSAAFTIGSWTPKISELSLDLGNNVIMREDASDATGYASALVTGRTIKGTMDPEALIIDDYDLYAAWMARTEAALSITLGSTGNKLVIAAPKVQVSKVDDGDRNGMRTDPVEFQCNRSAAAGDDALSLTFS